MTHIYLIRHGDYDEVENGKSLDNPGLAPRGVRQVELLRERLAHTGEIKTDTLIASPARRAQETARILASVLSAPLLLDRDLEEWRCDNGALSPEEFAARWQHVSHDQQPFFRWVEGGESWVEFTARVQLALNRIGREYEGKTIVIISHGGVIQASFSYFFNLSAITIPGIAIENTAITHWSKSDTEQRWTLHEHNDHHHLKLPV